MVDEKMKDEKWKKCKEKQVKKIPDQMIKPFNFYLTDEILYVQLPIRLVFSVHFK